MWKHKITGETKTEAPKEYRANYPGTCSKCSGSINRGEFIQWVKRPGQKGLIRHTNCADPRVSPWIEIAEGMPYPLPAPEPKPETRPDELYDMQVPDRPDSEPNFDETPSYPERKASSNGSDALLDLISERVESKVIDDIRSKVDSSIKIIEKTVQDKLDKLSIPSIEIKRPELPNVKLTHVHKQFKEVLELLNAGEYVYLHGSPGGHKSSIGPQLADALGVRYGYMSLCEQTPEYVVKGFTSPIDGKYYESMFVDFYENGGLFCWEELDAANDNLRTALNTMLENKMAALDKGLVKMSDKFYLLGNGNTCGRGAHPAFPSRTSFDAAFAARFFFLEFEYDWDLAKHISLGLNKHSGPVVDWAKNVSNWALCNGVQLVMSPREVYKIAKLAVTTSLTADRILDGVLRGLDIPSKEKLLSNYPFPKLIRG